MRISKGFVIKTGLPLLCLLLASSVSIAAPKHSKKKKPVVEKTDQVVIPRTTESKPAEVIQTNLKRATLIRHYSFSVQAPKGWSFIANGWAEPKDVNIDHSDAMLTLTPTADTKNDSTFLSVRTLYGNALPKTLDELFTLVSKDTSKVTKMVRLNGQRWIFSQYETKKADGSVMKNFAVRSIVGTRGYLALAGTPAQAEKIQKPQILKILNTIKLSP